MSLDADVIIIGAGPAGLAAARAATDLGATVVVIEQGASANLRDHATPDDLGRGVGGCGLFSDGKFSFRPAASALWTLKDSGLLDRAEGWCRLTLGLEREHDPISVLTAEGDFRRKTYPAHYLSLERRRTIIDSLAKDLRIVTNDAVTALT